jgi:hypothetical protein
MPLRKIDHQFTNK